MAEKPFSAYQAKKDEIEAAANPVEQMEEEKTVKEILADKEESELFGLMLEHTEYGNENQELMARFYQKKPEGDDFELLAEQKTKFLEKRREIDNVASELTPDMVEGLFSDIPELKKYMAVNGTDTSLDVLKRELPKFAFTNPRAFEIMSRNIEMMQSFNNGEMKASEEKLKKYCEEKGFELKDYQAAIAIEDTKKHKKALSDLTRDTWTSGDGIISRGMGYFAKGVDSLLGRHFSSGNRKEALKHGAEIEDRLTRLSTMQIEVGKNIIGAIKSNEDIRSGLSAEMIGVREKEKTVSPKEVKDVLPKSEDIVKVSWPKYQKDKRLTNWATMSDADKDRHRDMFIAEMERGVEEKLKGKLGFLAMVMRGIFTSTLKEQRVNLN